MILPFTKMHGIGNDYVYVNGYQEKDIEGCNLPDLARRMADRHFGVGSDGLILVLPPEPNVDAHVRMRMFNADGSESEMCGNGIRCVCKLAHDRGLSRANPMKVQTGRGVLALDYTTNGQGQVDRVTVDMGEPIWDGDRVPVRVNAIEDLYGQLDRLDNKGLLSRSPTQRHLESPEGEPSFINYRWLSMGNPHIVFFTTDVKSVPLAQWGAMIECHQAFPRRVNAHFVQVNSRREVTMRTWERGSGMTLACGTGASAVCAAGAALNLTDREILAHLPGGDLTLRWDEKTNHVFMTGPATEVFSGVWTDSG